MEVKRETEVAYRITISQPFEGNTRQGKYRILLYTLVSRCASDCLLQEDLQHLKTLLTSALTFLYDLASRYIAKLVTGHANQTPHIKLFSCNFQEITNLSNLPMLRDYLREILSYS